MKLPKHIEDWSDERASGNGIIVTLQWGYTFESGEHEGVRGFDTLAEAKEETKRKNVYRCNCRECASKGAWQIGANREEEWYEIADRLGLDRNLDERTSTIR